MEGWRREQHVADPGAFDSAEFEALYNQPEAPAMVADLRGAVEPG